MTIYFKSCIIQIYFREHRYRGNVKKDQNIMIMILFLIFSLETIGIHTYDLRNHKYLRNL